MCFSLEKELCLKYTNKQRWFELSCIHVEYYAIAMTTSMGRE